MDPRNLTDRRQGVDLPVADAPGERAGVAEWAAGITENELPLFAQNLSEISSVASRARSSAADLAEVITMDISMSVRLLKIANSPLLNPQNRPIDSIRAAVVLMGFDAVRDLAFSLSLVSELHRADSGEGDRVVELLAHAFHAAAQAQVLARAAGDRCPEETFVASLLLDVGEMAFWSRPRRQADAIRALMAGGVERGRAERRVLGFALRELSGRLAEDWRMSGLLRAALGPAANDEPRCRSVLLGDAVANVVERHGWASAEAVRVLDQVAELTGLAPTELEQRMREATRGAAKMARRFGVPAIERFLARAPESSPGAADEPAAAGPGPANCPPPNPQAELVAVRELQAQLKVLGKPDIDKLMRLALDGLHAGAGVDRAFFAVLSRDRGWLEVRHAAGAERAALLDGRRIEVSGGRTLSALLLKTGKAVWIDAAHRESLGALIGPDIDAWARGAAFFAMPVSVRGRPVGLLYADRSVSGRALDETVFASFRFFGEQIAVGLGQR